MYEVYTNVKRPDKALFVESGGRPSKADPSGYVPAGKRIAQMMMAGARLRLSRADEYDMYDGIDEDFVDVTRQPNYDIVDAQMSLQRISHAMSERRLQASQKAQVDPPASQPASGSVPPPNGD